MNGRRLLWISMGAHALLIGVILFFGGFGATHGLIRLDLDAERLVEIYGVSDAGSYLSAALALVQNGSIPPDWQWTLNLWPPGMIWLDAAIVAFSPLPVGISVAIILALVWGIALGLVTWPFVRMRRWWVVGVVLLVELFVLATPPFQSWMFDEGILYADGIAAAALLASFAVIAIRVTGGAPTRIWIRDGILVGIGIAVSVYFRASNNLIPIGIAVLAVVLGVVVLVARRSGRVTPTLLRQFLFAGVSVVVAFMLMAPYGALVLKREGRIQFVATESLVYVHTWQEPGADDLPDWLVQAGSTVGCDLDRERCAELAAQDPPPTSDELRDALIETIVAHPGDWAANRVWFVLKQWFGDELSSYQHVETDHESGPVSYSGSLNQNVPAGLAYLALLVAALAASIVLARRGAWSALILVIAFLALLAPFAIVHVEVRYLVPIKLIGLVAPTLLLALAQSPRGAIARRPRAGSKRTARS